MPIELYRHADHRCLMFSYLASGDAVQANQFLIVDGDTGAVLDPGGNVAYSELYLGMTQHFPPHKLTAIIASHADPDIVASLDRWLTATDAKVYISEVWERFIPHFCKPGKTEGRVVGIPDAVRASASAAANCTCCRLTSCTRKATSSSGIPPAASCFPAIWASRSAAIRRRRSKN